jgi:hypothetical protein
MVAMYVLMQKCENFEKIEHSANVTQLMMSDKFLKRDIPVIVTDATNDWPARRLFTLKFLHDVSLCDLNVCLFLHSHACNAVGFV